MVKDVGRLAGVRATTLLFIRQQCNFRHDNVSRGVATLRHRGSRHLYLWKAPSRTRRPLSSPNAQCIHPSSGALRRRLAAPIHAESTAFD